MEQKYFTKFLIRNIIRYLIVIACIIAVIILLTFWKPKTQFSRFSRLSLGKLTTTTSQTQCIPSANVTLMNNIKSQVASLVSKVSAMSPQPTNDVLSSFNSAVSNINSQITTLPTCVYVIDPCAGIADSQTNIGATCYQKVWNDAGCTTQSTYGDWQKTQTLAGLKSDSNAWATLTDSDHRIGCYGMNF